MRWRRGVFLALLAFGARSEAACMAPPGELLRITGEIDEGGLHGTFSRNLAPATGRFAEAIKLGSLTRGSGFDGHLAWSRDVSGASHSLTSEFARKLAISEAWLSSHLSCTASGGIHRRFTPPGGAPIELWYDRHSGHLDRAMLQYSENRLIHRYSDWRRVSTWQSFPFTQRDEDPEDRSDAVYTARHVERQASASFKKPPLPKDSRIIGGRSTTVPFEDDNGRRVYLPVYLNGKGPFAFELDNGGHFILTAETAKQLGLSPQGSFKSAGAGNTLRQASYVKIDNVRVGQAEMLGQTAKVLTLSHNDRPGRLPRAGILGLEFFERFVVGIDHRRKTVSLEAIFEAPATHLGTPVRLLFDEDAPLVRGRYGGATSNFMLDIGNAGPTIIEDYWARRHGFIPGLTRTKPKDSEWLSTGTVGLGPFRLSNVSISYFGEGERGSESTHSIAGIFGEPLLSRFNAVYDYGRQTVWLEPLVGPPAISFEKRP